MEAVCTAPFLESYVMGRLRGEELDKIEDHLLVCPHCQSRAKHTQQYVEATRIAAERIRSDQFFRPPTQPWWRGWIRPIMAHRGWAAAGALALGMVFALSSLRQPGIEYREVALQTTRGVETGANRATGRNVRVRLKLDMTSVNKLQLYQVQVVDADGNPVWQNTNQARLRWESDRSRRATPLERQVLGTGG